jgi:mRNA-degrading endonuclease toxin of MazEF toxin-antitoxin module
LDHNQQVHEQFHRLVVILSNETFIAHLGRTLLPLFMVVLAVDSIFVMRKLGLNTPLKYVVDCLLQDLKVQFIEDSGYCTCMV